MQYNEMNGGAVPTKGCMMRLSATFLVLVSLALTTVSLACKAPAAPSPVTTPLSSTPTGGTPVPLPTPRPPLEVKAAPGKAWYLPGEKAKIEFTFSNTASEAISVKPFPPAIDIRRPRPWETVWSSPPGAATMLLNPQQAATYTLEWDQRDSAGQQVAPGYYYVYVDVEELPTPVATFRMSYTTITKLLVQFPQGAMEKTIEVNQPQTASGLTIIFRRLELSSQGASVYALALQTDWTPPPAQSSPEVPTPLPTPPPHMYPVPAQYSLDGAAMRDAGSAGFDWLQEGIKLVWDLVDPVPSDAKELIFVITRFGELSGRWEYHIPLR